jgi:hypothetical protein
MRATNIGSRSFGSGQIVARVLQTTLDLGNPPFDAGHVLESCHAWSNSVDETKPLENQWRAISAETRSDAPHGSTEADILTRWWARPECVCVRPTSDPGGEAPSADSREEVALGVPFEICRLDINDAPFIDIAGRDMTSPD